jgi:uncharacterized membrane protein (UPF0136 family)
MGGYVEQSDRICLRVKVLGARCICVNQGSNSDIERSGENLKHKKEISTAVFSVLRPATLSRKFNPVCVCVCLVLTIYFYYKKVENCTLVLCVHRTNKVLCRWTMTFFFC